MPSTTKSEEFLSNVMNLFNPLQIEVSPNYPIANADGSLNETLVRQIEIEIQQAIARLSDGSTRFFENDSQLTGLITSSGGHKKSLYRLMHDTMLYAEGKLPVQQRAIGKARGGLKYTLSNSVDESQWDLLAKVHRDPYCAYSQIEQYTPLLKWSILQYEPGSKIEWYRVHPLLIEVQRFRRAIEDFR